MLDGLPLDRSYNPRLRGWILDSLPLLVVVEQRLAHCGLAETEWLCFQLCKITEVAEGAEER